MGWARVQRWPGVEVGAGLPWLLLLFSLADGVLTRALVGAGMASEANPLMRAALVRSPAVFLVLKLLLVGVGAAVLWRQRRRPLAFLALLGCLAVYAAVVACQLAALGIGLLSDGTAFP